MRKWVNKLNKITKINFVEGQKKAYASGLTQWDQGQHLEISGLDISDEIVEVHFSLEEYGGVAERMLGEVQEGIIRTKIPQFILEGPEYCPGTYYTAFAWIYLYDEESAETVRTIQMEIDARPKPPGYIHTEEELKNYESLKKRIEEIEKNGVSTDAVGKTVKKYLEENPITVTEKDPTVPDWAKQPKKPSYTATEVGALSDKTKVPTKTSELENDSGFITKEDIPNIEIPDVDLSEYATKEYVDNYSVVLSHDGNGNATIEGLVVLVDGNEVEY